VSIDRRSVGFNDWFLAGEAFPECLLALSFSGLAIRRILAALVAEEMA
jgi:hypothetical protein